MLQKEIQDFPGGVRTLNSGKTREVLHYRDIIQQRYRNVEIQGHR